jgi:hypothetical protein
VQLASFPVRPEEEDVVGCKLYDILKIGETHNILQLRSTDMKKNVTGCMHKIETLREQCQVISERQMFFFQESMKANTKNLEDVFKAAERSGSSLEIMQILMSGTLVRAPDARAPACMSLIGPMLRSTQAFEILDRITGEWSVVQTQWAKSLIVEPLMDTPFLWFIINSA